MWMPDVTLHICKYYASAFQMLTDVILHEYNLIRLQSDHGKGLWSRGNNTPQFGVE